MRTSLLLASFGLALTSLAACSSGDPGGAGGSAPGPFEPRADTSEGLTNASADLDAVLEHGALKDACAAYEGGQKDRKTMLLCGKYRYFYESFGTAGVPAGLATFLIDNFPDEIGPGFTKLGMIEDPGSAAHLPLGLAPGAKLGGKVDTLAFTCASCHLAKLPDGRYAVGAPNHAYQYGMQNLAIAVFPIVAFLGGADKHDPAAIALLQPLLDKVAADPALKDKLTTTLTSLISAGTMAPSFPPEAEHHYATWKPGTMDFLIEPLPMNDGVHTISKISAIWGIPDKDDLAHAGMASAMLGWTGGTKSMLSFARQFVSFGGGPLAEWPDDRLEPLVEYVYSLRAPKNPTPPDAALVTKGEQLFAAKCADCHDAPRGGGKRVYTYEEIGTDAALKLWLDPEQTGEACCMAPVTAGENKLTHGLKAPRLAGTWAMGRFLHNGSVDTLEDLFCLSGPRGKITEPAFGDAGHDFTCNGLADDEKKSLVAYLRAH